MKYFHLLTRTLDAVDKKIYKQIFCTKFVLVTKAKPKL